MSITNKISGSSFHTTKKSLLILGLLSKIFYGDLIMAQEHLSLITTPIFLLKSDERISQGTGFFYSFFTPAGEEIIFLVTNYHVLTGNAPSEGKAPKGDQIAFYLHADSQNPENIVSMDLPLFTNKGEEVWIKSEKYPEADVAVIPFSAFRFKAPKGITSLTISTISEKWINDDIKIRPASTITLIGYPYGFFDKSHWLPIWKTGNVASEPYFDFEGQPMFVADVSAFPGMSGSPVFAIFDGSYETASGGQVISSGRSTTFLGIFASLQTVEEKLYLEEISFTSGKGILLQKSLELANVWKRSVLEDIFENFDSEAYKAKLTEK